VLRATAVLLLATSVACSGTKQAEPPGRSSTIRSAVLITIDTLRADRVGAYGDAEARTPVMDLLAARGVRFTNAFSVAPITLTSHASILTGRYPAGHGARHNGIRIDSSAPALAESLSRGGVSTAAFVAAFPLDRRFGLIKGFQTYGDHLPRGADGRPVNERPGQAVVDEALAWLREHRTGRFFLWVHLFEPHAPYGDARTGRPVEARYRDDVAEADHQVGRLLEGLGDAAPATLVVLTADHGEAFGEHGEIAHSIFVYDTTLRVPLIISGPGIVARTFDSPVSLVDLAPTIAKQLGAGPFDADGIDLFPFIGGASPPERTLYAESFAPLLDFGWSPLRAVRADGWKFIAAPKPELYRVAADRDESKNLIDDERSRAASLQASADRFSSDTLPSAPKVDAEVSARLHALGYVSAGSRSTTRPDPKDRREMAARIAQVTSGELHGAALERVLQQILAEEPRNPLANVRLGYVLAESNRCAQAIPRFRIAIDEKYPSADPYLGLASCQAAQRDFASAASTLRAADIVEAGNPVVLANLGLVLSDGGHPQAAIAPLERALAIDPDLHQARFALAIALASSGQRDKAAAQAQELLRRLPADAPQRPEVERLLAAVK
jgi:arylsulfatase A-like enzyme/Flp pilus assembly protein TadD